MPLPPDIQQRIQRAKARGFTDEQIAADIQRKYGASYSSAPKDTRTGVEKVGDFLGIGDFARGLAQTALRFTPESRNLERSQQDLSAMNERLMRRAQQSDSDPVRKRLLQVAGQNAELGSNIAREQAEAIPSNRQFIGSAVNTALLTGGGGTIGAKAAGRGILGSTRFIPQPLRARVAQSTLVGGGFGGARSFAEGGTPGQIAATAAGTGLLAGGLTGLLGGLVGKVSRKATTQGAERLYKISTGMRRGEKANVLVERGITGNRAQLQQRGLQALQEAKRRILSRPEAQDMIPTRVLRNQPSVRAFIAEQKLLGHEQEARKLIDRLMPRGEGATRGRLFNLRVTLDKTTPPKAHEFGGTPALEANAKKAVSNAIRTFIPRRVSVTPPTASVPAAGQGTFRGRPIPAELERLLSKANSSAGTPQSRQQAQQAFLRAFRDLVAKQKPGVKVGGEIPDIAEAIRERGQFGSLLDSIAADQRARDKFGGFFFELIRRMGLTPAVGTRLARGLYQSGAPARALDRSVVSDPVRQYLRTLLTAGSTSTIQRPNSD